MERERQLKRLRENSFDILVIGGGATGAGIGLDAVSRGLRVAVVERDDFASGTSSKSTKLLHGGVRYLEKAVLQFDRGQLKLVYEALHERTTLMAIAPHLAHLIAILTPIYSTWEIPYYTTGLKMYDWLAGSRLPQPSRYLRAKETLRRCPMLNPKGLRGSVLYYDGQFDDARMNVCIAVKAAELGAAVVNHVEVTALRKTNGRIDGATLRDTLTAEQWTTRATTIINATGPFVDSMRHLDDPKAPAILAASSGTHIVLAPQFSAPQAGLLIPKTEDGRVLFLLPWLGHTLVGTTDNPSPIERFPKPSQTDIEYILRQLRKYFALAVSRDDVLAAWTGLRPLVSDAHARNTAQLSRDHVIVTSPSGLITIAGGKWTTYRRMAEDTVDEAVKLAKLPVATVSRTASIKIAGGDEYRADGFMDLQKEFGIAEDVARYLNRAYGDRAREVAEIAREGYGTRLAAPHPYLEAEVLYGALRESAHTSADFLARRIRLAFLDKEAAWRALPRVQALLGEALNWDRVRREQDRQQAELAIG